MDEAGVGARPGRRRRADRAATVGHRATSSACVARMAKIPERTVSTQRPVAAGKPRRRPASRSSSGRTMRSRRSRARSSSRRPGSRHPDKPSRRVPVRRADRRRQDRGRPPARQGDGRRVPPLRHERVHGAPHRLAAHRRAARLRRLRPGRPADRRDQQDPALRAAARRDRKGPSRPLQHPAPGDGPRLADRQQRAQGGLPQRHPGDDHQRRRARARRAR